MTELTRKLPPENLACAPCAAVALSCALDARNGYYDVKTLIYETEFKTDGYLTLRKMNTIVRDWLPVAKYVYYKRGERPKLKDIEIEGFSEAIICVLGHYLYLSGNTYSTNYITTILI